MGFYADVHVTAVKDSGGSNPKFPGVATARVSEA